MREVESWLAASDELWWPLPTPLRGAGRKREETLVAASDSPAGSRPEAAEVKYWISGVWASARIAGYAPVAAERPGRSCLRGACSWPRPQVRCQCVRRVRRAAKARMKASTVTRRDLVRWWQSGAATDGGRVGGMRLRLIRPTGYGAGLPVGLSTLVSTQACICRSRGWNRNVFQASVSNAAKKALTLRRAP